MDVLGKVMRLEERIQIIPRRLLRDERGWFLKVITGKEEHLPQYTGEVYLTMAVPGQSKGGHFHRLANEWFTVIEGNSMLKLEDVDTHERMEIPLGFEDALTVMVPSNVAHVFVNMGSSNSIVLAYTDQLYDPVDTIAYSFDRC